MTKTTTVQLVCDKYDRSAIHFKLAGMPDWMRVKVAADYSHIYQTTLDTYQNECPNSQTDNAVFVKLARKPARQRANAYLKTVMDTMRADIGRTTTIERQDRLRLDFLGIWDANAPHAELLEKEQQGQLTEAQRLQLGRQRRARWQQIKAFCKRENITFPGGTPDSKQGNGSRFARLISRDWMQKQVLKRDKRQPEHQARSLLKIGKHAMHYLTNEAFKAWQDDQAAARKYMQETVFVSHEDDEVDMEVVYNSTTANPRNRKFQLLAQVTGMVNYAEKYGYKFVMITPTAASEHHPSPRKDEAGQWVLNPKFNARWTPKATHEHLNVIWERVQSAMDREGIEYYGFKGIEAHKDGTPHHHYGLFYRGKLKNIKSIWNHYYWEVDQIAADFGDHKQRKKLTQAQGLAIREHLNRTQPGAVTRRVNYRKCDEKLGTLINYIMKSLLNYVIKDVQDGIKEGEEESPKQAKKRANQERLAAWASLHGIRQFVTLRTNASVGVYQELRRIHDEVEDSTQLEQERSACCGTFGTAAHDDKATRKNADFCRFMELRRNPKNGAQPVKLVKATEYESDALTIRFNRFDEEVGRVTGVVSESEGLEITTRPIRWRAVHLPTLQHDLVERELGGSLAGAAATQINRKNELNIFWAEMLETARKQKTLHGFGRTAYGWPVSGRVAVPFSDRAQPVISRKIRSNPTFSAEADATDDFIYRVPIPPGIDPENQEIPKFDCFLSGVNGEVLPEDSVEARL